MSFCTKCGRKRSGQERYCTACGALLRVVDDQTGTVVAEVPPGEAPVGEVPVGTVLAEASPDEVPVADMPVGTVLADVPPGEVWAGTVLADLPPAEVPVADMPVGTVLADAPDVGGGTGTVLAEVPSADVPTAAGPTAAGPTGTELALAPPTAGIAPGGAEVVPSASPTMSIAAPPPPPLPPPPPPLPPPPPPFVPVGSVPGSGAPDTMPGVMPGAMPGAMPGGGQTGPPGWLPPAPPRAGRDWGTIAMVMAAVIVLAGAGVFAWLKFGRPSTAGTGLGVVSGVTVTGSATASTSPTTTPSSSAPSVTPTQTSPASTLVPVGPGVTNDAQTAAVDAFVTKYFTAINAHNYQRYLSLINPANRQNWTLQTFENGYGSTTDSQETLISITDYGFGVTGASLSFISHQLPSQSATGTSCTDWESITLFLRQSGGQYFIGTQLPGYHPQYRAC